MVGIVIVSQFENTAKDIKKLAHEAAPEVPIEIAFGNGEYSVGLEWGKVKDAVNKVYGSDGVLILIELGSINFNAESAIEFLDESIKEKVHLVDTVLVEGIITAAVESSLGKSIKEIKEIIKPMEVDKII